MAGLGWRRFTRETLSSLDVQGYLMDQAVMRFDSIAQRAQKLVDPSDGMVTYLEDVDDLEVMEGGGQYWIPVSGRWREHTGGALPTTGVREGDIIASSVYQCPMIRRGGGWRQAGVVGVTSLNNYIASLQAAGIEGVHNGFLVMDTDANRIYACMGALNFMQVAGRAAPTRSTAGWTSPASGWAFVGGGVTWYRSVGNGLMHMYVEMTRTGAALTVPANGDIGNVLLATAPATILPMDSVPLHSGSGGRVATGFLGADGGLVLGAVAPGSNIAMGETISLGGAYRLERAGD